VGVNTLDKNGQAGDVDEGIEHYLGQEKQGTMNIPIGASPKVHAYKGARQRKVESVYAQALIIIFPLRCG
jgi:hypothetical protein